MSRHRPLATLARLGRAEADRARLAVADAAARLQTASRAQEAACRAIAREAARESTSVLAAAALGAWLPLARQRGELLAAEAAACRGHVAASVEAARAAFLEAKRTELVHARRRQADVALAERVAAQAVDESVAARAARPPAQNSGASVTSSPSSAAVKRI